MEGDNGWEQNQLVSGELFADEDYQAGQHQGCGCFSWVVVIIFVLCVIQELFK